MIAAVGDATHPTLVVQSDGAYFYLRMRRDGAAVSMMGSFASGAWGCEIDTDSDLANSYELLALVDGKSAPAQVSLWSNSTKEAAQGPNDDAETAIASEAATDFARQTADGSDFFLEWKPRRAAYGGAHASVLISPNSRASLCHDSPPSRDR